MTVEATSEPTDDQLRELMFRVRQQAQSSSPQLLPISESSPTAPGSSTLAQQSSRVVSCGMCRTRGVEPVELCQEWKSELRIYWPVRCDACNEWLRRREDMYVRRQDQEDLERRLKTSGLMSAYASRARSAATLDDGPDTDGWHVAREICARLAAGLTAKPWVYLHGANGTYKSTLACVTLAQEIHLGGHGAYLLWPDAIEELRSLNRPGAEDAVFDYVERYYLTPRLVIDEIGLGTPTQFAADQLFRLFERRYQLDSGAPAGRRWTIFTSNVSVEDLAKSFEHLDDGRMANRLRRRIAEMSVELDVMT
jgi:DNA replication protein DnaC